jgi:hypothetical protein
MTGESFPVEGSLDFGAQRAGCDRQRAERREMFDDLAGAGKKIGAVAFEFSGDERLAGGEVSNRTRIPVAARSTPISWKARSSL